LGTCLGVVRELFGSCSGVVWELLGSCLEVVLEVFGSCLRVVLIDVYMAVSEKSRVYCFLLAGPPARVLQPHRSPVRAVPNVWKGLQNTGWRPSQ
jgi:hypothetical protein